MNTNPELVSVLVSMAAPSPELLFFRFFLTSPIPIKSQIKQNTKGCCFAMQDCCS